MTVSSSFPDAPLRLTDFGQALFSRGEVSVRAFSASQGFDDSGFEAWVREVDSLARADLPSGAPDLDVAGALWAARKLYLACQFLVCREASEATLREALSGAFPAARTPATDYSVDLLFQFLPDLFAISNRIAPGDALTQVLAAWAVEWPLSSVGIPVSGACDTRPFDSNPALLRLYVDRVVERLARDRLETPAVRDLLQRDAGLYPDLLPFPNATYTHA